MAGRLGKKIDTWEVTTDAGKYQILCYMGRGKYNTIQFTAICEGVSPRYQKTMDNVQELEADARKEVRNLASITWSPMILVETGARQNQALGRVDLEGGVAWAELTDVERTVTGVPVARVLAELSIDWQIIEVATRPDGKQLYRYVACDSGWGKQTQEGLPKTFEFSNEDTDPWLEEAKKAQTLLPYSEQNIATLTALCNQLGSMAIEVARLLGPAAAAQTLQHIQQNGLARLGFAGGQSGGTQPGLRQQDRDSQSVGTGSSDPGADQQADGTVGTADLDRPGRNRQRTRRKSGAK